MDDLRAKYLRKTAEYDAAVRRAIAGNDVSQLPQIRKLNSELSVLLDKMIEVMTFAKKETPLIVKERDELVKKLRRIQMDYNGLLVNTDTLETLRRIRQQEGGAYERDLYRYLLFFFVVCVGVLLMILFVKKGQAPSTASSAPMPTMSAPLM
jgi:hypothetical protein